VELLRRQAERQPDQIAYSFLRDGEVEDASLTYRELDLRARSIAQMLRSIGASGGKALLFYPAGLEYIAAFFGCLFAQVVAVPVYQPRLRRTLDRLISIAADCEPSVVLTTEAIWSRVKSMVARTPEMRSLVWQPTDNCGDEAAEQWSNPGVTHNTLVLLQYTSGSTSTPKGVMITHDNLLHNEAMIQSVFQQDEHALIVGWLPLYHDMGLIGNVIQPLYAGARSVLMSPAAFLQAPVRWLQAISRYRATTSGGPNFAYDLCVRKITAEQRRQLDLSSWEVAFNGAEPIRADTLEQFASTFASCGFRLAAFSPCYGLAEATLLISGKKKLNEPVIKCVSGAALTRGQVVDAAPDGIDTRRLVGCGDGLKDQQIAIVHSQSLTPCGSGEIGEIWVSGPSIAQGYWNRRDNTETFRARLADTDAGPYLRTGDLGFMQDKELFVTGRLKDLIIIRGLNHYPQDIELTMERSHPALRPGCGAAFAVEIAGVEKLVLVQEVEKQICERNEIFVKVRQAVTQGHETEVHQIILLRPNTIPKTSSGKIQRHACRARFLEGRLEIVASWQQPPIEVKAAPASLSVDSTEAVEAWLAAYLSSTMAENSTELDVTQPLTRYGLDSLMSVELVHRVERDAGVVLPMSIFLEDISLQKLAESIVEVSAAALNSQKLLPTSPTDHSPYPLSKGQEALWVLYKRNPESSAYNISTALLSTSPLDVARLSRALQVLIERHSLLRTIFFSEGGKPFQHTNGNRPVRLEEIDATSWTQNELDERLDKAANLPFDLEQEPMVRVTLYNCSARKHVLLVVIHHIVSDFWSFAILMRELGTLYSAAAGGSTVSLAPLTLEYADYVQWQSRMLDSPQGERLWSYWQTQLAGHLPVLDLFTDVQRPPGLTNQATSSYRFKLDKVLTQKLKALGRERSATLYMVLLAAFQVLLYRYTSQNEILVGSPTTGRNRVEFAGLIGYFANLVVLRADFSGSPTFAGFLERVRQIVLGALEHQDYPFSLLVKRLRADHEVSVTPLFQAAFVMQKSALPELEELASFAIGEVGSQLEMGALSFESVALEQADAQFDLSLMAAESNGAISASLKYNTALYDGATIERLATHFQNLVKAVVAEPEQSIIALGLLSASERRQMLVEWNDTTRRYPPDLMIPQLFEAGAARTPDAIAVRYEDQQLSYRELNQRANRLAHYLRDLGVGAEVLVGLCMNRSVEMIVALLGILKAGGAYVPLDPQYPVARLSLIIKDTAMPVLLTQQDLLNTLPRSEIHVVSVDSDWQAISQQDDQNPAPHATSQNTAYVIYTSGSTGDPKGVMISHDAICNRLLWMQEAYQLSASDRVLQKTPYTFDVSVWEFFWPLLNGAQLIVTRPGGHQEPGYLGRLISEEGITVVHFVPSMLQAVLNEPGFEKCTSLRRILCSGEALPYMSQQKVFAALKTANLHNLYGPTEAAVDVSHWTCERTGNSRIVPIGYPIANMWLHVLDQHQEPVPIGVPGELHIGGVGLARGYLNRPDLTAEKFIPDPHSSVAGARLYATGDRARYLRSGALEFLGRLDHQIKLRGQRIETGEIEAALVQHGSISEAVVTTTGDASGAERLVAYVVLKSGLTAPAFDLRNHLKQTLPTYMLPAVYVMLDKLPLGPNGKLNRQGLPTLETSRPELLTNLVGPRDELERALTSLWCKTLWVDEIGIHDNFFELGGHSLLATQMVTQMQEIFPTEVPLLTLFFQDSTVAGLAQGIKQCVADERELAEITQAMQTLDDLTDEQVGEMLREREGLETMLNP